MAAPDFLVVGHLVRDLTDEGWRPGGTALYAALVAARLGLRTAVLTSAAPDLDLAAILPGIEVVCLPSPRTTAFQNIYQEGRRIQYVRAAAAAIASTALPDAWRDAAVVLLGPVLGEVDVGLAKCFPRSLVGLNAQGWLRELDADGRVLPADPRRLEPLLPYAKTIFASHEDVQKAAAAEWAQRVPLVIYTEGDRGARLWQQGHERHVPAVPARVADPTGAGDAFAAAFLVRWRETSDAWESAHFAAACASFVVEAEGAQGVPSRAQIERRLSAG